MKLGAYPTLDPWDQNRDGAKQWEVYMHSAAHVTGGWSFLGATGTLAYHLSADRSSLRLRERWAKGLARTPRVAAAVGASSFVAESLFFPFMNSLPPEYAPCGYFLSKSVLGGLVASSFGRNPRSAATTGLLFGAASTSLLVIEVCFLFLNEPPKGPKP